MSFDNYARKRSCGKVMFLNLYVSHSVHTGCITAYIGQGMYILVFNGRGGVCRRVYLPKGCVYLGCLAGGCLPGGCQPTGCLPRTPPADPEADITRDNHWSGWYTSYWNTFLFGVYFDLDTQT